MNSRIAVLMYHEISPYPQRLRTIRSMHPAYCVKLADFEQQLQLLAEGHYRTLRIEELDGKTRSNANAVALTFDDGLAGNYAYAFPELSKAGFHATFFVAANLVGKQDYMNWNQLRELSGAGMSIESHCLDHHPLTTLCDDEIRRQLRDSKATIEEKIGTPVTCVSFPHGSYNRRILDTAEQLGYDMFVTSDLGYYSNGKIIPRCVVPDTIIPERFSKLIECSERAILFDRLRQACTRKIKALVGLNRYRKFYRHAFRIQLPK